MLSISRLGRSLATACLCATDRGVGQGDVRYAPGLYAVDQIGRAHV